MGDGVHYVTGPPGVEPLATILIPTYSFTVDGTERNAAESCAAYLGLLDRMVAEYKSDCQP